MGPSLGSSDPDHAIPSFHYQVCTSVHHGTGDGLSAVVDAGAPVEDADAVRGVDAALDAADEDLDQALVLVGAAPAGVDEDLDQVPALADEVLVADEASEVQDAVGAAAPDADEVQDPARVLEDVDGEAPV